MNYWRGAAAKCPLLLSRLRCCLLCGCFLGLGAQRESAADFGSYLHSPLVASKFCFTLWLATLFGRTPSELGWVAVFHPCTVSWKPTLRKSVSSFVPSYSSHHMLVLLWCLNFVMHHFLKASLSCQRFCFQFLTSSIHNTYHLVWNHPNCFGFRIP